MSNKKPILVYVKTEKDKKFTALSSLQNFTYAPTLMHASLIPYDKKQSLIEWCDHYKELCIKNKVQIELRHFKGKAIYKVGTYKDKKL